MEGDFAEDEASTIAEAVARLGLADVRAFGLAWEVCAMTRVAWMFPLTFPSRVE